MCSLTSNRDLSGGSPDDGRFPVRPSSLIPTEFRRRSSAKAGVTKYLRRQERILLSEPARRARQTRGPQHEANDAAPKDVSRRELLAEAGTCGGDSVLRGGSLTSPLQHNGWERRTTGVRSTARVERAVAKVGKVSRVASALPHSEGAAYKRQGREVAACLRDWRMGS